LSDSKEMIEVTMSLLWNQIIYRKFPSMKRNAAWGKMWNQINGTKVLASF